MILTKFTFKKNKMKNTITKMTVGTLSILLLIFSSCSEKKLSQKEMVKKNAEQYLKQRLDDPESYEFVELKFRDSVLFKDNIEREIKYQKSNLDFDKNQLKKQKEYKAEGFSLFNEEEYKEYKNKVEKGKRIIQRIDSVKNELGEEANNVAAYSYFFKFRANNKLGAKTLHTYVVQTKPGPNFEIINMTGDKGKIILNPNRFPGYNEIMGINK